MLLEHSDSLRARISLYTVPLFFLRGDEPLAVGTGVLVRLGRRFFILSAGHCVERSANLSMAVGIRDGRHRFEPSIEQSNYVYEPKTERDLGYWELNPAAAAMMTDMSCLFASETSLEVTTAARLLAVDDSMVLAGYPGAWLSNEGDGLRGVRLLSYSTFLSGTEDAPPIRIERHYEHFNAVELWIVRCDNVGASNGTQFAISVPELRGVSGGSVWRSGLREKETEWRPSDMKLVAVHSQSVDVDAAGNCFSLEVLIGHHLYLIAQDYGDLSDQIWRRWPTLEMFADQGRPMGPFQLSSSR